MDKILLQAIKVMGTCGVNPLEKLIKQPFSINVTIDIDLEPAGKSDDLNQTVDYGLIYEKIKKQAENSRYNLIESLAESIADMLLTDERIEKVRVGVEKSQARHGTNVFPAVVVIERNRKQADAMHEKESGWEQ